MNIILIKENADFNFLPNTSERITQIKSECRVVEYILYMREDFS
jgi:hypothetical protein